MVENGNKRYRARMLPGRPHVPLCNYIHQACWGCLDIQVSEFTGQERVQALQPRAPIRPCLPLVNEKVRAIICLGHNNDKLIETFGSVVDFMIETDAIEDAVKIAYKLCRDAESVLYSPAAVSGDLCENYESNGNKFKQAVRQL